MYNRYIPQSDGTYRKNRVQDPGRQSQPAPTQSQASPQACPQASPPVYRQPQPSPLLISPEGLLRQLLPKDFDTEDLLVILLLLLMAGEGQECAGNALLTLALYLFL